MQVEPDSLTHPAEIFSLTVALPLPPHPTKAHFNVISCFSSPLLSEIKSENRKIHFRKRRKENNFTNPKMTLVYHMTSMETMPFLP